MDFGFLDNIAQSTKNRIVFWFRMGMFLISVIVMGAIVVDYGFVLDEKESAIIQGIYDVSWWCYFFTFIFQLSTQWRRLNKKTGVMTLVMGVLLLLSAVPKFFTLSEYWQVYQGVWSFLESKMFILPILGMYAILEISKGVITFINKKTNPAILMAASFAVIIIIGALLLLVPRSTLPHIRLPLADAIFISTSAVCVTGLSTVDVAQTFTIEGQIIIALLIQIGGLGVMTITSFFTLFFMGGTGLYSQFALKDMVGSETFSSLVSTLLYILGFTFVIEAIGALCIWMSIHATMGFTLQQEIFFSIFHAVSAFCNAGFSTLSGNLGNPAIIQGHNTFYIVISALLILGGIGYPILMNMWKLMAYYLKCFLYKKMGRGEAPPRYIHVANFNTKIVLLTTAILLGGGTFAFALFEWNGAFAGMPVVDKLVHSLFNAAAPRTAGFNSVDLTTFSTLSIIVYSVLMWIGGASQSTAGGIKVNTVATAFSNLVSVVKGRSCVTLFGREITPETIRRAGAVISASIFTILFFFALLVYMEPEISPASLLFETISAVGTVGSSLNVTHLLGDDSKIAVTLLMFIGRVGLITVLMTTVQNPGDPKYRYPKDNVIIN